MADGIGQRGVVIPTSVQKKCSILPPMPRLFDKFKSGNFPTIFRIFLINYSPSRLTPWRAFAGGYSRRWGHPDGLRPRFCPGAWLLRSAGPAHPRLRPLTPVGSAPRT